MRSRDERRSSWFPLTAGCTLVALLLAVGLILVAVFGVRTMRRVRAELRDPERRTATARELLGGDLPPGYRVEQNLPMWPLARMVFLSSGAGGDARYFVYLAMRPDAAGEDPAAILARHGFERGPAVFAGSGRLEGGDATVDFQIRRGPFVTDDGRRLGSAWVAELSIDCPEDADVRFALWAAPAEPATVSVGEVPRAPAAAGTPGDPAAIRELLSHFDLCPD